jgi:hypothetical protein
MESSCDASAPAGRLPQMPKVLDRSARATHGQATEEACFQAVVDRLAGTRALEQTSTLYGRVA